MFEQSVISLVLLPLSLCFAGFSERFSWDKDLGTPFLVCAVSGQVWKAGRPLPLGLHLGSAVAHLGGGHLISLVSRTDSAGAASTIDLCPLLFSSEMGF